jgi:hypothetical protein
MRVSSRWMGMGLAASMFLGCLGGAMAAERPAAPGSPPPAKTAPAKKAGKSKKAAVMYECKHCNVKSDKAGKCPKCGMEMTKVEAAKAKGKAKGKTDKGDKKGT